MDKLNISNQNLLSLHKKELIRMKWKKQIIVAIFLFLIILTSMYIYRLGIIDKIRSKMFVISYDNGDNQYEKIIKNC